MAVTVAAIIDGITTTLAAATGITSGLSYDELLEGVPGVNCPMIQVYPDAFNPDPGSSTDRTTFQAGIQLQEIIIFVDVYARVRSQIAQDMKAAVDTLDNLVTMLQTEEKPPFFGVTATDPTDKYPIKSFRWSWKRAVFVFGSQKYMGGRFTITVRVA